jgi:transposase
MVHHFQWFGLEPVSADYGLSGRRNVIDVEEWAEIRRLHRAEGMAVKAIVRQLGVARNTVRAALRSDGVPKYVREGPGSSVDAFEPEIRRLLAATPDMPATVVAERIGWARGMTVLRDRVAELRPAYQVPDAFGRTEYKPGELGQWDLWFPAYDIPVGHGQTAVLPVLVGVPCYSRWILARMIGSKESADVLGGHLALLVELGAVPRVGVYDGEPAISVRRGKRLIYTHDYLRLKGTLGMGSVVLAKGHPERKGCVERVNGYLETSFMPGRRFENRDDFNTQLGDWLETKANVRVHSGLRCRPSERIDEDLAAMMALPPVLPDLDWHHDLRLPADHWVRHQSNDYSVHPKAVGRRVHVTAGDARVTVTIGKDVVACHERVLASHVTVTDPAHDRAREAARALAGAAKPAADTGEVEVRDLAVYDQATGAA